MIKTAEDLALEAGMGLYAQECGMDKEAFIGSVWNWLRELWKSGFMSRNRSYPEQARTTLAQKPVTPPLRQTPVTKTPVIQNQQQSQIKTIKQPKSPVTQPRPWDRAVQPKGWNTPLHPSVWIAFQGMELKKRQAESKKRQQETEKFLSRINKGKPK